MLSYVSNTGVSLMSLTMPISRDRLFNSPSDSDLSDFFFTTSWKNDIFFLQKGEGPPKFDTINLKTKEKMKKVSSIRLVQWLDCVFETQERNKKKYKLTQMRLNWTELTTSQLVYQHTHTPLQHNIHVSKVHRGSAFGSLPGNPYAHHLYAFLM